MVEVHEVEEVATAQIVAPLQLGHVRGERIRALVAEDRIPAVAVAEGAEPRVELRIAGVALIADALVVRSGNAEHVEAVVAVVEVRSEHILLWRENPNVMSIIVVGVSVHVVPVVNCHTFVKPPSPVALGSGPR